MSAVKPSVKTDWRTIVAEPVKLFASTRIPLALLLIRTETRRLPSGLIKQLWRRPETGSSERQENEAYTRIYPGRMYSEKCRIA